MQAAVHVDSTGLLVLVFWVQEHISRRFQFGCDPLIKSPFHFDVVQVMCCSRVWLFGRVVPHSVCWLSGT